MIDSTFLDTAIGAGKDLAEIQTEVIEGITYSKGGLVAIKPPMPAPVQVRSLTAVSTYVARNPDGLDPSHMIVHVISHDCVKVYSPLDEAYQTRRDYLVASPVLDPFEFGRWRQLEEFNILLQSRFTSTDQIGQILKLTGNITDGVVKTFADDGVTQVVTAKTGIARQGETEVPTRVRLQPYRTFHEIPQPESEFLLRLRPGGRDGETPSVALFESDGGAWKLAAMDLIGGWLQKELPTGTVLIA